MHSPPLLFARVDFRNDHRIFGILPEDRRPHTHILGKTGTGKSALLKHFITHDLRASHGLTLIDPHGDLVSATLDYVSTHRTRDVIYFNPADQDYPVGLNILESVPRERRFLVASHVVSAFHNLWKDSWRPRLEYLLLNCVLTLLDIENSTLLGIPRLLSDKAYRRRVLPFIEDRVVQQFWIEEYERYPAVFQRQVIAPLQNKVGQFLSGYPMRNIVGQPHSTFSMDDVIDQRKILLCNFAKGTIGEANAKLLGSLVTTKLFLTAPARQSLPELERTDHYLYLDECQAFSTSVLGSILSESRKYRLNLTRSHQFLDQLDHDIVQSILGNVGTIIAFRLGSRNAETLEAEFSPEFTATDLQHLERYQIYLKLSVSGQTRRPFSARTLPPPEPTRHERNRENILVTSRLRYATPRAVVEEKIRRWMADTPGKSGERAAAGTKAFVVS